MGGIAWLPYVRNAQKCASAGLKAWRIGMSGGVAQHKVNCAAKKNIKIFFAAHAEDYRIARRISKTPKNQLWNKSAAQTSLLKNSAIYRRILRAARALPPGLLQDTFWIWISLPYSFDSCRCRISA